MQIMPFEDAKTYRFNPFDLTKVWPHADYPLIEVGRMTLDRNPTDNHTEIEQARVRAEQPGARHRLRARTGCCWRRMFSYADAHRYRHRRQLQADPGQRPRSPVHTYSKDGAHAVPARRPTRCTRRTPRAARRPTPPATASPPAGTPTATSCAAAYTLHAEDDDWGQAGTLVREVMDDAARERLVDNIVGHLLNGVTEPVLQRAFEYWRNVDKRPGRPDREGRPTMS